MTSTANIIVLETQSKITKSERANFFKSKYLQDIIETAEAKQEKQPYFVDRPDREFDEMMLAITNPQYKIKKEFLYALPIYKISNYKVNIRDFFGNPEECSIECKMELDEEEFHTSKIRVGWFGKMIIKPTEREYSRALFSIEADSWKSGESDTEVQLEHYISQTFKIKSRLKNVTGKAKFDLCFE